MEEGGEVLTRLDIVNGRSSRARVYMKASYGARWICWV